MSSLSTSEWDLEGFQPRQSLWKLVEDLAPENEQSEIKEILGEDVIDETVDLHKEVWVLISYRIYITPLLSEHMEFKINVFFNSNIQHWINIQHSIKQTPRRGPKCVRLIGVWLYRYHMQHCNVCKNIVMFDKSLYTQIVANGVLRS